MDVLCEHLGCKTGEPITPVPGRPAGWGGYGPGPADLDGPACQSGLDYCCGLCGCQGE